MSTAACMQVSSRATDAVGEPVLYQLSRSWRSAAGVLWLHELPLPGQSGVHKFTRAKVRGVSKHRPGQTIEFELHGDRWSAVTLPPSPVRARLAQKEVIDLAAQEDKELADSLRKIKVTIPGRAAKAAATTAKKDKKGTSSRPRGALATGVVQEKSKRKNLVVKRADLTKKQTDIGSLSIDLPKFTATPPSGLHSPRPRAVHFYDDDDFSAISQDDVDRVRREWDS